MEITEALRQRPTGAAAEHIARRLGLDRKKLGCYRRAANGAGLRAGMAATALTEERVATILPRCCPPSKSRTGRALQAEATGTRARHPSDLRGMTKAPPACSGNVPDLLETGGHSWCRIGLGIVGIP